MDALGDLPVNLPVTVPRGRWEFPRAAPQAPCCYDLPVTSSLGCQWAVAKRATGSPARPMDSDGNVLQNELETNRGSFCVSQGRHCSTQVGTVTVMPGATPVALHRKLRL